MFAAYGAFDKLIRERRETFRQRCVYAPLPAAKRLRYSTEELQKTVAEVCAEINGQRKTQG